MHFQYLPIPATIKCSMFKVAIKAGLSICQIPLSAAQPAKHPLIYALHVWQVCVLRCRFCDNAVQVERVEAFNFLKKGPFRILLFLIHYESTILGVDTFYELVQMSQARPTTTTELGAYKPTETE